MVYTRNYFVNITSLIKIFGPFVHKASIISSFMKPYQKSCYNFTVLPEVENECWQYNFSVKYCWFPEAVLHTDGVDVVTDHDIHDILVAAHLTHDGSTPTMEIVESVLLHLLSADLSDQSPDLPVPVHNMALIIAALTLSTYIFKQFPLRNVNWPRCRAFGTANTLLDAIVLDVKAFVALAMEEPAVAKLHLSGVSV